jgi:hypothetical protein
MEARFPIHRSRRVSDASETRSRDGSAADRKLTPGQTAAVSAAVLGAYSAISFGFDCQAAHHLLRPSLDQFALWATALAAPLHQLARIVSNYLNKLEKASEQ